MTHTDRSEIVMTVLSVADVCMLVSQLSELKNPDLYHLLISVL
jgi:hypothetical protein